jgi:hypothetical protein
MTTKLAKAWRTQTMRDRLTAEQLEYLRRARMGYPPATLMGWHLSRVGSQHEPPLDAIEGVLRALEPGFSWDNGRHTIDLRHELRALREFIDELRGAYAEKNVESAVVRAIAIGAMFTRLAYLLLDGDVIASGAASERGREKARPAIGARLDEQRASKDMELSRLLAGDRANPKYNRQRSHSATAARLAPLYAEVGDEPLSVETIRKWLAKQN